MKVRDEGTLAEAPLSPETLDGPELYDGDLDWDLDWDLTAPESWEGAVAVAAEGGRTRCLVENTHGMVMLETDAEVLRGWPRGEGIDPTSSEAGSSGPEPVRRRPTGPLSAARVDDAFGERHVVRIPDSALPGGLEHPGSRRHLRVIGLPGCGGMPRGRVPGPFGRRHATSADGVLPEDGLPSGVATGDPIAFGTSNCGELYLHRHEGSVHIWSRLDGSTRETLVQLAPDLVVFTRILEAVHRYSNACWHPCPVEGDREEWRRCSWPKWTSRPRACSILRRPAAPCVSRLYAGITELGEDGFQRYRSSATFTQPAPAPTTPS